MASEIFDGIWSINVKHVCEFVDTASGESFISRKF